MDLITPLPVSQDDRPLLPVLREHLVDELERRGRTAVIVLVPVLALLWELSRDISSRDPRLQGVFAGLAVFMALRVWNIFLKRGSPETRHLRFTALSTAISLLTSAFVWIAFPHLSPIEAGLVGMALAGVNAAAIVSMAPSLTTCLLYVVPMIGTLIAVSTLHPVPEHPRSFQSFAWLYLLGLVWLGVQVHAGLRREILTSLRMEDFAVRDPLTGLHNRRFLGEFMISETSQTLRAWRQPESLHATVMLMIVDIDHFKRVNDHHGHAAGDAVLVQLSALLRDVVRKPDLVVRWGGEEFLIVARHTTRTLPIGLSDRICQRVAAHDFTLPGGKTLNCTCSLGFALYPFLPDDPSRLTWEQCVALADVGLYLAKEEGRNRWVGLEAAGTWPEGEATFLGVQKEPGMSAEAGLVRLLRSHEG
ncbi:MAG TPA: GGDEF domain-containing protein [Holophagaceae bacterium]|nr:GGDEF domain-containing protein [Holophagaceae bacterium]